MNSSLSVLAAALTSLVPSGAVLAWHFEARFVGRVGSTDVLIHSPYSIPEDHPTRIRLQFGVFDDASGAAPAGGFVGWNVGTLSITGIGNPLRAGARRTPGRLAPFNFAAQPNANGDPPLPGGDPFGILTSIDNTVGIQSPPWTCVEHPLPEPQPPPVIRGLNTFVSVFEVTLTPLDYYLVFELNFQGNFIAATEWRTVGNPTPPDCGDPDDPSDDIPGQVTYAPFPTPGQQFSGSFTFVSNGVPGPAGAWVFGLACAAIMTRRR
ncbi:MAG: hypothetical protein AB7G11_00620 [Phycisphaerales bacterium]